MGRRESARRAGWRSRIDPYKTPRTTRYRAHHDQPSPIQTQQSIPGYGTGRFAFVNSTRNAAHPMGKSKIKYPAPEV